MHHFYVDVLRIIRVALTNVEVSENLIPHAIFHKAIVFPKVTEILFIFALHAGELAQLVERLHGMQKVTGSTPVFSTSFKSPQGDFLHDVQPFNER